MNRKILIPGLGIAKSMGFGCVCNLSYEELLINPSTLLWVDKLCIPRDFPKIEKNRKERFPEYAIKAMIDLMGEHNLVEVVDDKEFINTGKSMKGLGGFVERELHCILFCTGRQQTPHEQS